MELAQTKQCGNCPWKVDRDLSKIPGYKRENHEKWEQTIVCPNGDISQIKAPLQIMACLYSTDDKMLDCIGWIYNQTCNNNQRLRLALLQCTNIKYI